MVSNQREGGGGISTFNLKFLSSKNIFRKPPSNDYVIYHYYCKILESEIKYFRFNIINQGKRYLGLGKNGISDDLETPNSQNFLEWGAAQCIMPPEHRLPIPPTTYFLRFLRYWASLYTSFYYTFLDKSRRKRQIWLFQSLNKSKKRVLLGTSKKFQFIKVL